MLNSLFSFPTFLLFSPIRLVRSYTWVQWKHLTPERSIDQYLQIFSKLLLLVPKVTTRISYPECIANLKLPIDAFYRESRSGVNIAKRDITTGLFGLQTVRKFNVSVNDSKIKSYYLFRKVFLESKFKSFCFVAILDMFLISRACKNDHIIFNVGTPSLEARNIRLVNIITYIIEESKLILENMSPNVIHC